MIIVYCLLYLLIGFICSTIMVVWYKYKTIYCALDDTVKCVCIATTLLWFIIFPFFIIFEIVSWWVDFIEDLMNRS